jgi:hypothetical protein
MAKKKVGNQTGSLTPDHEKSGIDLISLRVGNIQHIVENLLMRATNLLQTSSIGGLHAKLCTSKVAGVLAMGISRLPLGSLGTKSHLDVAPLERRKVYYKGEGGGFPQVRAVVSLECLSCRCLILAPKVL